MKGYSFTLHKIHIFLIYDRKICLMWHFSWSNYKMKCVRGVVRLTVWAVRSGGRYVVCTSVACESSDAAPSQLSTWLDVLIQVSLLDHHYIDSAAQRAETPTDWTDGSSPAELLPRRKSPHPAPWINDRRLQARAGLSGSRGLDHE